MVDGALEGVRRRRAAQDRSPPRTGSCLSTAAVSGTRAARGFRWSDHHFRSLSHRRISMDWEHLTLMIGDHPSGMPVLARRLRQSLAGEASSAPTSDYLEDAITPDITPARLFLTAHAERRFSESQRLLNSISNKYVQVVGAYSVKTNPDTRLLTLARSCGFWAECISQLEVSAACRAGFGQVSIKLNGPAKRWPSRNSNRPNLVIADSVRELQSAIKNADTLSQAIGIRICPRIFKSRFGVSLNTEKEIDEVAGILSQFPLETGIGLHFHLASSAIGAERWVWLADSFLELVEELELRARRTIGWVDLGGGWHPDDWVQFLSESAPTIVEKLSGKAIPRTLVLEPGKAMAQPTMAVASRVITIRDGNEVVVDASIAELPDINSHPHRMMSRKKGTNKWYPVVDGAIRVYGRLCMETDVLASGVSFVHRLEPGDEVMFLDAGAYDVSMAFDFGRGQSS